MAHSKECKSREFYLDRIGRLSQIGGITPFLYDSGRGKGTSALRVRTAGGLEFWVVPDRGLDIFEASYKGKSLVWHSPTGMVHPSYAVQKGLDWLHSFAGGLICTCGLSTAGAPSEDMGDQLGLHGPISNTPAERANWSEAWDSDDCLFSVTGTVRESSVFGHNLLLERNITTSLFTNCLTVRDTVENQGIRESPLMVLYHLNLGFPFLTETSEIYAPSLHQEPATGFAQQSQTTWNLFEAPRDGIEERVYFHRMRPDGEGKVTVVLVSDGSRPDLGVSISYSAESFPEFIEWKMTGKNHFVLGLEPSNCRSLGRKAERDRGTLQSLMPGERRTFEFKIGVLDGFDHVRTAMTATHL